MRIIIIYQIPKNEVLKIKLGQLLYLVKYYTYTKVTNKKRPILAGVKLTHRCTLKCRQCPFWRRPGEDIKFTQLKETMKNLYEQGVRIWLMEGGEPLLWRDGELNIHDIVAEAKKYFYCVGVTTNGTLPIDVKTDVVWVSVDGLRDTHNYLRSNSFDKVIENIKKSRHPKLFSNIVINRLNYQEIPELVKFLSDIVKGITIQFFFPYPESEDLALTWEQREKVLDELIELKKEGWPLVDSFTALKALKKNTWKCEPWMVVCVERDGTVEQGCYLKNRTPYEDPCKICGLTAHTELSLAYQLNWEAINVGRKTMGIF
ncbi:radical SAM protein [Candidatus Oleimmundimicrobium sp.]|uniref:radical SAM protein n=1 Tax=Candidatus Oleimmundimicrobium sp. TaxID=3060597 RepID=UPI002725B440|nr:radical SAM protein [Candidatus Oleimmundimicrobium sp.]MDO8886319.1 radical SAM protein [Candidatus Oleimmundimicrobium sp.]